jgi:hypothetical protein
VEGKARSKGGGEVKDLVEFAELVKARLVAEGHTCLVPWGREAAQLKDNQGPGTANRVVIYDGPPDEQNGQWVRHTVNQDNTQRRENPGQFYRWQRVTLDVWGYNSAPGTIQLDGGKEEAGQFRAKDCLVDAVERAVLRVVKSQGHRHTFYEEVVNNRSSPMGRRHGDRAVFSFEIAFVSRDPAPLAAQFKEASPSITGVVSTPSITITEEAPE